MTREKGRKSGLEQVEDGMEGGNQRCPQGSSGGVVRRITILSHALFA